MMADIADGFGRKGKKEFLNSLNISHGLAAEIQSYLYVALDQKYITQARFETIYEKVNVVSKMIQGFMSYLNHHLTS